MGYTTSYNLTVFKGDLSISKILESEFYHYEDLEWALDDNGETNEPCKWYNHENDLKEISKKYPQVVFKLTGEGEEGGDLWVKYFNNGLMQYCPAIITYEDYDESKLK